MTHVPLPDFETPDLATAIEAMPSDGVDLLPFGVIGLDRDGVVRTYNRTEAERSGYGRRPSVGLSFFSAIAPCMGGEQFLGRIEKARAAGTLDIRFTFVGDFADADRQLTVRVQSASSGGIWIFIDRRGGVA